MSRILSRTALTGVLATLALVGGTLGPSPAHADPAPSPVARPGVAEPVTTGGEGTSKAYAKAFASGAAEAVHDPGAVNHNGSHDEEYYGPTVAGDSGYANVNITETTLMRPTLVSSTGTLQVVAGGALARGEGVNWTRVSFVPSVTERWLIILDNVTHGTACAAGDVRFEMRDGGRTLYDIAIPCGPYTGYRLEPILEAGHRYEYRIGVAGKTVLHLAEAPPETAGYSWSVVMNPNPADVVSQGAPTISGKAKVGKRLHATTGAWAGLPQAFEFQWLRNNRAIPGATGPAYKLRKADRGKRIKVRVAAIKPYYYVFAYSAPKRVKRR